jgi:ABC-type branched-subunit amino acid transport system ATPase component
MLADPKVLLLDEPSAGLSPKLASEIIDKVQQINASGVTIFMIEQNVTEALRIADRVTVLVSGSVRVLATPPEFGVKYDLHKLYLN